MLLYMLSLFFLADIRVDWQVFELSDSSEKVIDFIMVYGDGFCLLDEQGNEIEESGQLNKYFM